LGIPVLGTPALGQPIVASFVDLEGKVINVANGTTLRRWFREYTLNLTSSNCEYPFLFELKGENARYDANYFFNGSRFRVVALPGDRVVMEGM